MRSDPWLLAVCTSAPCHSLAGFLCPLPLLGPSELGGENGCAGANLGVLHKSLLTQTFEMNAFSK